MREPPHLHSRLGFTLLEFTVVICVVALLAGLLLERVQWYQERAEKAAMEQTLGAIRSALHLQVAALVAKGKENELHELLKENPVNWLTERPSNYAGEYFAPLPQDKEKGFWYFDLQSGKLIYSLRHSAHFHAAQGTGNELQFRTRLVTASAGQQRGVGGPVEGVVLEPVFSYTWF